MFIHFLVYLARTVHNFISQGAFIGQEASFIFSLIFTHGWTFLIPHPSPSSLNLESLDSMRLQMQPIPVTLPHWSCHCLLPLLPQQSMQALTHKLHLSLTRPRLTLPLPSVGI